MMTVPQAFDLALQRHRAGQFGEAERIYRQVLAVQPNHAEALHMVGVIAHQTGRQELAVEWIRRAIALDPNNAAAHSNLGEAYRALERLGEAVASYRRALQLNPNFADAYNNLGVALWSAGQLDEAISACQQALQLQPDDPKAYYNLGNALRDRGQSEEAIAVYRRALDLRPDYLKALNNLGNAQWDQGRVDEAVASYRRALEGMAADPGVHSNLVMALHYLPGDATGAIIAEQERWNRQFGESPGEASLPYSNDRSPERRLRIGYVSPDLWDHVAGRNLIPLFRHHEHRSFEIVCYSGVARPDGLTEEIRRHCDRWNSTVNIGDDALAKMIRADEIDILVDLSQHGGGNRLPVFAHRPAPVQVSFAGYPESTGVGTIEYRISDRWLEAEMGSAEFGMRNAECGWKRTMQANSHAERVLGLSKEPAELASKMDAAHVDSPETDTPQPKSKEGVPQLRDARAVSNRPSLVAAEGRAMEQVFLIDSFWCYDPCGIEAEVSRLPARETGCVTFGSLNTFRKINEAVLRLWARVLGAVSGSRLVLLSAEGSHRRRPLEILASAGIKAERVEFVTPRPRREYLELYHRLDLMLDPFPYNGHTTSLDALWMGVPVVTLAGERPVSRAGLSHLSNLGLSDFVAFSEDEYVRVAVELAHDQPRLAELRATLRSRMEGSALMDAPRFARQIEAAYRGMWRQWCREMP